MAYSKHVAGLFSRIFPSKLKVVFSFATLIVRSMYLFARRRLLLAAISLLAVSSIANATASTAQFAPSLQTISTIAGGYVEAGLGGVRSQYPNLFSGFNNDWNYANWQFAVGADAGYRFDSYLAAELGYQYFFSATGHNLKNEKVTFTPMGVYAAAKLIVPVYTSLDAFFKFGLSYTKLNIKGNIAGDVKKDSSHWGPVFGVGAQYHFNDSFSISSSYMRYPGFTDVTHSPMQLIPAFNVITFSLGYHFMI